MDTSTPRQLSSLSSNSLTVDEEKALACLLAAGQIFLNSVDISYTYPTKEEKPVWTTAIYVNANDVFMWACADAECITQNDNEMPSEIGELYKLWKENPKWGSVKWLCIKRNLQPQFPIKRDMKADGYWDEKLESLPPNKC